VLRQAQDEENLVAINADAITDLLILSLSKDAQRRCNPEYSP
jgi:hypothetical protein